MAAEGLGSLNEVFVIVATTSVQGRQCSFSAKAFSLLTTEAGRTTASIHQSLWLAVDSFPGPKKRRKGLVSAVRACT